MEEALEGCFSFLIYYKILTPCFFSELNLLQKQVLK
jgi:hypothetical protein